MFLNKHLIYCILFMNIQYIKQRMHIANIAIVITDYVKRSLK